MKVKESERSQYEHNSLDSWWTLVKSLERTAPDIGKHRNKHHVMQELETSRRRNNHSNDSDDKDDF